MTSDLLIPGVPVRALPIALDGDLVIDFRNRDPADATSALSSPAVSATSTGLDREWVWAASSFANNATSTPPSGVTERADVASGNGLTAGTKDQSAAGSSGSLTNIFSGSGATGAWLGALKPESPGQFLAMW